MSVEHDYPPQQFSLAEQHRIMNDLERSKERAVEEGDGVKSYYLNQII